MTLEYEAESIALATALNAKGFHDITWNDVHAWLDGETDGNMDLVDEAAKKILGANTFEHFINVARLWPALEYAVGVSTEQYIGGIDLSFRAQENV